MDKSSDRSAASDPSRSKSIKLGTAGHTEMAESVDDRTVYQPFRESQVIVDGGKKKGCC